MKIGFIGLGNLGFPIAENLLSVHKEIYLYNRTFSKANPLIDKGAILCSSVKELAQHCDIVFTIVADDAAIKEITLGENGLAMNLKDGGIHASNSTYAYQFSLCRYSGNGPPRSSQGQEPELYAGR
jgi:3-hydroxyisobutyrate dehydrogenase-like beta-hydroxyacid dehydrogenase